MNSHNLGYHLAQRQHRVLLIDIDPQASLTKFMGLNPAELDKTVADAIIDEQPLLGHQGVNSYCTHIGNEWFALARNDTP